MTTADFMKISSVNGKFAAQVDVSKKLQDEELKVAEAFAGLMNQTLLASNQMADDVASSMDMKVGNAQSVAESYERYSYKDNQIDTAEKSTINEKLEEVAEDMESAEQDVLDAIGEAYDVSEEEIQELLDEMGLSVLDLLNPENLVNFIMQLTGASSVEELLMDESFLQIMEAMDALKQGLMNELNVDEEGLQELVSQMELVNEEAHAADELPEEIVQNEEEHVGESVESVEVDMTTAEKTPTQQESFASNQNSQENSFLNHQANSENMVLNQVNASVNTVSDVMQSQFTSYVSTDTMQIMEQIVQQMKVTISAETTSMEMQLNPENLGKVYVNISSEEGVVNAQFRATNEIVKEALEAQIATLRENLNQAGVKVDAIEVTIASHEFERNLEQNQQNPEETMDAQEEQTNRRRNISVDSLDELSGVMTEEETLVAQIMKDNGNSIDFTA